MVLTWWAPVRAAHARHFGSRRETAASWTLILPEQPGSPAKHARVLVSLAVLTA
jgi:hypothetical protein